MTQIRLNKFLASCGVASRRKVEDMIFSKLVKINEQTVDTPYTMVDPENDIVKVNNKIIKQEKKYYFILNKPKGYICSNVRKPKEKLVTDLFKDFSCRLYTVGRLDKNTTGLLIITNDGDFANKVIHPSSNLEKEYIAAVKEIITPEHIKTISKGAYIENRFVKPIEVIKTQRKTLKIVVKEGKKREVKIFIRKANLTLLDLKRVRIGKLKIGSIPYGYYKKATLKEVEQIF